MPLCICHSANAATSCCRLVQEPLLSQLQDRIWKLSAPSSCLGGEARPKALGTCHSVLSPWIWNNSVELDKRRDSVTYDKSLLPLAILLMPLSYLKAALLPSLWVISLSDSSVKKLLQAACTLLEAFPHISVFYDINFVVIVLICFVWFVFQSQQKPLQLLQPLKKQQHQVKEQMVHFPHIIFLVLIFEPVY